MTAQDKEYLGKLHKKYYGKKKESIVEKVNKKLAKTGIQFVPPEPGDVPLTAAEKNYNESSAERHARQVPVVTRASLMAKAKAQGIKYFRILTKAELFQVLDHPGDIVSITEKAKARWKAGMKKKPGPFTSVCAPGRA